MIVFKTDKNLFEIKKLAPSGENFLAYDFFPFQMEVECPRMRNFYQMVKSDANGMRSYLFFHVRAHLYFICAFRRPSSSEPDNA